MKLLLRVPRLIHLPIWGMAREPFVDSIITV